MALETRDIRHRKFHGTSKKKPTQPSLAHETALNKMKFKHAKMKRNKKTIFQFRHRGRGSRSLPLAMGGKRVGGSWKELERPRVRRRREGDGDAEGGREWRRRDSERDERAWWP